MRKSCDPCGRRKKKCDGGRPCRRCVGAEEACTYSKRRWPLPRSRRQAFRDVHPSMMLRNSKPEEARAQGLLSLNRCRLSASPATGLVGMQENVFLSDFFGCVGFLPLTTQSYIRETMVKLLATSGNTQRPGAVLFDGAGVAYLDPIAHDDACGNALGARDPSTCTFWCAVALGALARGSPVESVSRYCKLARHGLSSSSGSMNTAERAMAWAILAYLYLFCGNTGAFQDYMILSESCLRESIEQGSSPMLPAGFAEIVHHRTTVKSCCKNGETGEVASLSAPPELNEAATEAELYTFVMRSYGIFEDEIYRAAKSLSETTLCGGDPSDLTRGNGGEQVNRELVGVSSEMLDTMEERLKEFSSQYERLEEVVERPSIRSGIGGLIINGALFLRKAAAGDFHGALERVGRCVDVFESFPGLCRFTIGAHAAHIRIMALAAMDNVQARELYCKLRTAYNSHRLLGSSPLPPLEEWQGISGCCEDFYCRAMERLILRVFNKTTGCIRQDDATGQGSMPLGFDGQDNGHLSTSIASETRTISVAPMPSSLRTVERDLSRVYNASPGFSSQVYQGAERRTRPTVAPPSLVSPNGETQAALDADLGDDEKQSTGGGAQDPSTLLAGPEIRQCGGVSSGTEIDNRLAAEDWMYVAHVLLDAVAEP